MLSIIVEYYFCVGSTHKPVMTQTLSAQEISHRHHYEMLSEILDICRKSQNLLKFLQGDPVGWIADKGDR